MTRSRRLIPLIVVFALVPATRAGAEAFTVAPPSPIAGEPATLTETVGLGNPTWDFGDGMSGTGTPVTHTWATAQDYSVTETGIVSTTQTVTVVPDTAPVAGAITVTPNHTTPDLGENLTFSTNVTEPDAGDAVTYDWNFDDGTAHSAEASPSHVFTDPGRHDVTVTVTDKAGRTGTNTVAVTPVDRPPVIGSLTLSDTSPLTGQDVTFSAAATDPDTGAGGDSLTYTWDFGDGTAVATGATVHHAYTAAATRTVKLTVSDSHGQKDFGAATVVVSPGPGATNLLPHAHIGASNLSPKTGGVVHLTATATDADGHIVALAWDLDNDGVFGNDPGVTAGGAKADVTFRTPGRHVVRLRATDDLGGTGFDQVVINVLNRPPTAAFRISPAHPRAGQRISLVSLAHDPDGPLSFQGWDLDGDGSFGDAHGVVAGVTFTKVGKHRVGLLVNDADGGTAKIYRTITVAPRVYTALSPFPVVRIAGRVSTSGARIRLLTVTAPRGSTVTVTCGGSGCPRRRYSHRLRRTGVVNVKAFEHFLRAGVRLDIRVTQAGRIGKLTRFNVHRGTVPSRSDLCVKAGRAVRCP